MDKERTLKAFILISFFVLNIAFNAYNKFLFSPAEKKGAGFQIPVLATMTHALAGFMTAFVMTYFPNIYTRKVITTTKMWLIILGISIFFGGSIGLNNTSLQFLSLSTQQIIRSLAPAAVAFCAYFIEDKRFSWGQLVSLFCLVLGVALAVLGDQSNSVLIGVFLCLGSVVASALQYTFVSITVSPENKLNPFDLLFYTSIPTIILLFPAFVANGEIRKFGDYVETHGLELALGYILIGQFLAVTYNLTVFTFIRVMSSVYIAVCGVFKVALVILFSIVVLGDPVALVNGLGLLIAFGGFCLNSYYEFEESNAKKAAAAAPTKADPENPQKGE